MPPTQSRPSDGPQNDQGIMADGKRTAQPSMNGLKMLFGALNSLEKDESYQELASVLKEVETLRMELASKEKIIKQLELSKENERENHESTTQSLINAHRKNCAELENERNTLATEANAMRESIQQKDDSRKVIEEQQAQMQAEIDRFKKRLESSNDFGREERQKCLKLEQDFKAAKDETDQLKGELKQRNGEITRLGKSKQALEKTYNDTCQKLESESAELERLRSLAVELRTETLPTTQERLENLWRDALYMVNKHFQFKLLEASEENAEFLERLKHVSGTLEYASNQIVPLPRRNSVNARNMRCALILAWLMRRIDLELFQPDYIVPVESGIRSYLLREAMRDSRRESFRRAFLLSVYPDEQERNQKKRIANICHSIMWLVDGIIEADQATALGSDLRVFIEQACTVWQEIQRLEDRFEPHMDYAIDDSFDWETLTFEDSEGSKKRGTSAANNTSDEPVLVIFPRMYIVKDAEPKSVTSGIVLTKSQTATAAQEARSEAPKSPTFGRAPRRDSIATNDTLPKENILSFLGQGLLNGQLRRRG